MLSDRFTSELGIALQAQAHVLKQLELAISEIDCKLTKVEQSLSSSDEIAQQLSEIEDLMSELEASQEWLAVEDFGDFSPDQILLLYEKRKQSVFRELNQIGFKNWDNFVRQCQVYTLSQGIDPLAPYEALLTKADFKALQQESYDAQYQWDKWDYIFVGASGVLAALTDYLLVRIPTTLATGKYAGQLGSPITAWLKKYSATR